MARSLTEYPVSNSRHDVTAWLAGKTRLTHEEADIVRTTIDREILSCGGRVPRDRATLRRKARCGILPVVGLWTWLKIVWQVYRAIDFLIELYGGEPIDEPQGCHW